MSRKKNITMFGEEDMGIVPELSNMMIIFHLICNINLSIAFITVKFKLIIIDSYEQNGLLLSLDSYLIKENVFTKMIAEMNK